MCCGLPTKLGLKGNGGGGKSIVLPLLTHTDWHDKRKDIGHLKAPPPQGHANVFVLILSVFLFFVFFVKLKEFYAPFVSVWTPMETKGAASKSIYLRTTKDKCCFHTHAVLSVQRGALFLVLFHIKWQICLFGNQHVCVVCCRTKIAGSCCTLVSHSFLHLVCKVKVVRAVWNGIFMRRLDCSVLMGREKGQKSSFWNTHAAWNMCGATVYTDTHSFTRSCPLCIAHCIIDVRDCKR